VRSTASAIATCDARRRKPGIACANAPPSSKIAASVLSATSSVTGASLSIVVEVSASPSS
jgi:hypothetical protein